MNNKFFILLLIPMALSITSFNVLFAPKKGKIELAQSIPQEVLLQNGGLTEGPPPPPTASGTVGAGSGTTSAGGTASTSGSASADPVAPAEPEVTEPEPEAPAPAEASATDRAETRVPLREQVEHLQAVVNELDRPLKVDIDGQGGAETTITDITISEPDDEVAVDLSRETETEGSDKIILTINSRTPNDQLEATMVDCDCDYTTQRVQIELATSELGLEEGESIEDIDQRRLQRILARKHNVIAEKIKIARNEQVTASQAEDERLAEAERAERDCNNKDSSRKQMECHIARVKEDGASESERDEALAEIEDRMRRLAYSDKSSDERLFNSMLSRLRGHEDLTDLRSKLEAHQEIRAEANEFNEAERKFNADIGKFNASNMFANQQILGLERRMDINGFLTPLEQMQYNRALATQAETLNNLETAQANLQSSRLSFHTRVNDLIASSRSSGVFTRHDITAARGYAFPRSSARGVMLADGNALGLTRPRARRGSLFGLGFGNDMVDGTLADTIRLRDSSYTLGRGLGDHHFSVFNRQRNYRPSLFSNNRRMGQHGRRGSRFYTDQWPSRMMRTSFEQRYPIRSTNFRQRRGGRISGRMAL